MTVPQQITFIANLEKEDCGAMFLIIAEKQQKTILNFSLVLLVVIE